MIQSLEKRTHPLLGFAVLALTSIFFTGCHSAFVQATVINQTGKPVRLFEVDYPSASFGSGELHAGARFHYRFKVLGEGPSRLIWTDAAEQEHTVTGPVLHEGQEGALTILIEPDKTLWQPDLHDVR